MSSIAKIDHLDRPHYNRTMKFIVKMWGSDPLTFDIRLFDGMDRDGVNVYICKVSDAQFYFESKSDDELWTILDNAICALKDFRKKEVR